MTRIQDVSEGDTLPTLAKEFTRPQLFRFSAITWNPHRIHYDPEYASVEGHPDVLVQQHLHGAVIQQLLLDWLGVHGELTDLSWRNVGRATVEQTLYVEAEVTDVNREAGTADLVVETHTDEDTCAEGSATVSFEE